MAQRKNKLIILSGATATGKTGLSIDISKKFNNNKFSVVNFDSLLFYKELNIGTAKPTEEEMQAVEHHLVNVGSISQEINANDFVKLAEEKINELHEQGKIPILVGGSTFYVRSLIKGMYESPSPTDELKEEIEILYKTEGIAPFIDFLSKNDPESLQQLHENDHYRLMRAFEHYKTTGSPISLQKRSYDENNPYDFSKNIRPDWNMLHISLELPKDLHWQIMEKRAKEMIDSGLIEEVKGLLSQGHTGHEKPMQSIGYKETLAHLSGDLTSKEELVERVFINTRRLAKSQKTFLKKITPKETFHTLEERDKIFDLVSRFLNS